MTRKGPRAVRGARTGVCRGSLEPIRAAAGAGERRGAEAACQRAIALDPTVADYYRTLQDIYGALQKPGKAEQVGEEAARHATRELPTA